MRKNAVEKFENNVEEYIKKNDVICIIRFRCNNANIAKIVNEFRDICNLNMKVKNLRGNDINVEYYKYIGFDRKVKHVYNENKEVERHFQNNNLRKKYFLKSTEEEFSRMCYDNKLFLFELIYCEEVSEPKTFENISDPINFQYILLFMDYLDKKKIRYNFLVSGEDEKNLYVPLVEKVYFQIRTFLFLCTDNQNNKIYVFHKSDEGNVWSRTYSNSRCERVVDQNFGRILPTIPINQELYKLVQSRIENLENGTADASYKKLIEGYEAKICRSYPKEGGMLAQYCMHDSYIEKLIFLSTLYYCLEDAKEFEEPQISLLHEICVDYAQGILQLIENACFHAIENGLNGSGNFSIRIRKCVEMQDFFNASFNNNISFFMEIYVTDLLYDKEKFYGIVEKLYNNIEERCKTTNDNEERRTLETVLATRETEQRIRLDEIFGHNSSQQSIYEVYLGNSKNIAYHYGLQILNNAISVGRGYMCVRSGKGNFYSNNNEGKYKDQNFNWENGTAYIIYLPLDLTEVIDYHDSIAIENNLKPYDETRYSVEKFPGELEENITKISVAVTPKEKENCILRLIKDIDCEKVQSDCIYCIDCNNIVNDFSYEIMAKVVFMCLVGKEINHVAILNVKDRQEVIKVFRQFALFYDRQGKSGHLGEKSVFIVDDKAQIDLLLSGTISDIKKNMYEGQIYGGIDEISMRIIEHLGRRGYENGV